MANRQKIQKIGKFRNFPKYLKSVANDRKWRLRRTECGFGGFGVSVGAARGPSFGPATPPGPSGVAPELVRVGGPPPVRGSSFFWAASSKRTVTPIFYFKFEFSTKFGVESPFYFLEIFVF